jgi:Xaa-Pro aminopeptidase
MNCPAIRTVRVGRISNGRQKEDTMNPFRVPEAELNQRIDRLQREMNAREIEGLLVIQRADLFYFSGTAQNGFLYIPAAGAPLLAVKRFFPRSRQESGLDNVIALDSVRELPGRLLDHYGQLPAVLALEMDVLPVADYEYYRRLFDCRQFVDGSPAILKVRGLKSAWEVERMEETAEMSYETFEYMRGAIRPGLSEMEFAGMYETAARRLGHGGKLRTRHFQSEGYPWHVLSGENGGLVGMLDSPFSGRGTSAAFPSGAGHRQLRENEPILVDFGAVLNGYHIDETRMFALGSMPEKPLKACRVAIDIHNDVIAAVKPGMTAGEVYQRSLAEARKRGYEESYLGPPGLKVRFVGHGIGVELIEPPFLAEGKSDVLQPGMTIALEPKLCFKDEFAAGVESVFRVTDTGARMISRVPVDIFLC